MKGNQLTESKPHYLILDALRGVAAILVVWYHVFEGYAFAGGGDITVVNHGYLTVDFFFMLSGFVISYAYDERWKHGLGLRSFFVRRLIRLHPMVIMGAIIGLVTFLLQGSVKWDGTPVAILHILPALLLGMVLIPAIPGTPPEIRGNGEMFPLNGPCWSLFFEYIGNIIYALLLRRLSDKALCICVMLSGLGLGYFALFDLLGYHCIGIGWTLDTVNFVGGVLRMLYPLSLGMLLARKFRAIKIKGAFWLCAVSLIALFHMPFIQSTGKISLNGVYEMTCISVFFPILVWLGASGVISARSFSHKLCNFMGDISFPLYTIHYPIMYYFYAWMIKHQAYTFKETWHVALLVITLSITLAYLCLKLYDMPVRQRLKELFIK